MVSNKEEAKEFIYSKKLFTGLSLSEAMKVSLIGLKAITRKEKKEIYFEYKEEEEMDKLRAFKFLFFNHSSGLNIETNLSINF